jgi:PAS domain S-box-containing protein
MTSSTGRQPSFDVESFIGEYCEAWSAADEPRILSYYSDDVVLQLPGMFMNGKEAVRDRFVRPFLLAFQRPRHRVLNLIEGLGVVSVEFSIDADHTGPFAGHAASRARVVVPGCGVYQYDAATRHITVARIYLDLGTSLRPVPNAPGPESATASETGPLNEGSLSLIVNTIPTTAWTTRPDGYCDFLNQRWLDYAGMTAEQATGWGWTEAIHPDDRPRLVHHWQSSLASGTPVEAEGRMRRFDGSYRWFLFRANPVRDASGAIVKWCGTNIDIEDRKRGEEALRASELSWRQIVDHIPALVCTWGPLGEVEFVNRQTLEFFGRTRDERQHWALMDAVHPDDLPRVIQGRKQALETGTSYVSEHRLRRADGVYRWFQLRALPVRNAEGTITAWYILLTDIDDRKRAEEALLASERYLSQAINTIPTFIAVTRPDGYILSVNQAALDYHGITLQDTQQEDFAARWFHPDDMTRLSEVLRESLSHPRQFECEYRALGRDGKYRWFLVRYNPLLDAQGGIERWYVTGSDIQARKESEQALQESARQFRLLVETIPALVWRSTPEGDLDYLNKRAVEYLGHTAESLAGGRWLELVHPEHRETTLQRWLQSATTGTAYEDEYRLRRADGQYRWIRSVGEPFQDTEGRIANWYGVVFDIDDRKRAEEAQARRGSIRADVNAAFAKPTHLAEILRGCMEAIVRHLDAAFARIWLLNKDESLLELQASAGIYTRLDGYYSRIPVGDLKVGWIAREATPHFTNDVLNDPRVHDKEWARASGMVAFAGYPLMVEGRLIGVVALFSRSALTDSILDTLALVADTLAK